MEQDWEDGLEKRKPARHSGIDDPFDKYEMFSKWDHRFLDRARHIASWSKDPNTQVGAVIVDEPTNRVVSEGYNGLPRGIRDYDEGPRLDLRGDKNDLTIHAEMNALMFAQRDLTGTTIYVWPYAPCVRCAVHMIQAGVQRVVAPMPFRDSSWMNSQLFGLSVLLEAGLTVDYFACDRLHDREGWQRIMKL